MVSSEVAAQGRRSKNHSSASPLSDHGADAADYGQGHSKVQAMFGSIAHRYDLSNTVLSMGIHHLWRRALLKLLPKNPKRALDLCTGTGDLIPLLQARCEKVVGADFCYPMLRQAPEKVRSSGEGTRLDVGLVQGDALCLPFASGSFDVITVSFGVRNFADTLAGLKEIRRVLAPGGSLLVLEFGQPTGLIGLGYRWYSDVVMPRIGGFLTGNRYAYEYLPKTAERFPAGAAFIELMAEAGFESCEARSQTFGIAFCYRGFAPRVVSSAGGNHERIQ